MMPRFFSDLTSETVLRDGVHRRRNAERTNQTHGRVNVKLALEFSFYAEPRVNEKKG